MQELCELSLENSEPAVSELSPLDQLNKLDFSGKSPEVATIRKATDSLSQLELNEKAAIVKQFPGLDELEINLDTSAVDVHPRAQEKLALQAVRELMYSRNR